MSYFPMFYAGAGLVLMGCFVMSLAMHKLPSPPSGTMRVHISDRPIYEALPNGNVRIISTPPTAVAP